VYGDIASGPVDLFTFNLSED